MRTALRLEMCVYISYTGENTWVVIKKHTENYGSIHFAIWLECKFCNIATNMESF